MLLNPIERIAVKVGKIALNPQEATKLGNEDPNQVKLMELIHNEDGDK